MVSRDMQAMRGQLAQLGYELPEKSYAYSGDSEAKANDVRNAARRHKQQQLNAGGNSPSARCTYNRIKT
jgi:hypothetical protein